MNSYSTTTAPAKTLPSTAAAPTSIGCDTASACSAPAPFDCVADADELDVLELEDVLEDDAPEDVELALREEQHRQ